MSLEHDAQCIENDARCGCYDDRIATLERELAAHDAARDRLATIVDETVGVQPVLAADELLTLLETWAHQTRIRADSLERELAAVTAERDALLAGKWAGPWDSLTHFAWVRRDSRGSAVTPVRLTHERAACDAALAKKGWYLAPTPPTGTPGDGTR